MQNQVPDNSNQLPVNVSERRQHHTEQVLETLPPTCETMTGVPASRLARPGHYTQMWDRDENPASRLTRPRPLLTTKGWNKEWRISLPLLLCHSAFQINIFKNKSTQYENNDRKETLQGKASGKMRFKRTWDKHIFFLERIGSLLIHTEFCSIERRCIPLKTRRLQFYSTYPIFKTDLPKTIYSHSFWHKIRLNLTLINQKFSSASLQHLPVCTKARLGVDHSGLDHSTCQHTWKQGLEAGLVRDLAYVTETRDIDYIMLFVTLEN